MVTAMESCELCDEFGTRVSRFVTPPRSRFLFESADFLVFPALGSFVEGYLLVCPRAHVPSCASLDPAMLGKLERLLGAVGLIIEKHYGGYVVFEHGMATCDKRAGGCIDHAHLHVIPGNFDLLGALSEQCEPEPLVSMTALAAWRGRPYLLTRRDAGPVVVCEAPGHLPSQFLRRHAAAALDVPDLWDWGAYLGLKEIDRTLNKLAGDFRGISL